MLDAGEYQRWSDAAESARRGADLHVAGALHNWACFMAEQAAQLHVKAALHGIGAGAWGHDLVQLGAALEQETGEDLPEHVAAALRRLARFYIPTRYPDAQPGQSPGAFYASSDSSSALADVATVREHLERLWGEMVAADEAAAGDGAAE